MVTDDERQRVARVLRGGFDVVSDAYGRFWLNGTLFGVDITARSEEKIRDGLSRLAYLIYPTCVAHRDQLFYPATDLTPEHEETVYRCGSCDEIVSYDEDYDPKTDAPAYCEMCGSRITGIGEPWDE